VAGNKQGIVLSVTSSTAKLQVCTNYCRYLHWR